MCSEVLGWVLKDFIPFGDLVSDVLLWMSLPRERPENYECSPTAYTIARTALGVGTVVDSIPEVALLLAIMPGIVAVLLFAPPYFDTGENGQALREITWSLWDCARHMVTDGKSIVYFVYHDVGEKKLSLGTIVQYSVWIALVLPHLPLLWLLRTCLSGGAYYKIVGIQATAGAVTGLSSVFLALVSGELLAVVSAAFAIYSLLISTMVAVQRGRKVAKEAKNAGVERGRDLADSLPGTACSGSASQDFTVYCFRPAFFIGSPVAAFLGLYYIDTGQNVLGAILTAVGFAGWIYVLCFIHCLARDASDASKKNATATEDCRLINSRLICCISWTVSGGSIMLVCGVYYFVSSGVWSVKAVSLIAAGGFVLSMSACCVCSAFNEEPFRDRDWPEHLRSNRTASWPSRRVHDDPHADGIERGSNCGLDNFTSSPH